MVVDEPFQDYMGLSIFACLCCFWPVGLCAIAKSNEARKLARGGDYESAREAANKAKKTAWVAMLLGLILTIALIVLRVVASSANSN
ncbi:synapse differentiation-inducing gene protein 1-like [Xenia sp. Carnegie-2017]|uniref:synapse differentiation-inducing gene protein 1-like n=1 Tax=Xenia sp. Carnegie-2017 TaxID=2897299 RepID=UPI001F045701|nr:synapse differentiation-inducing gene protein 1-like [Xenia sp. Carnegie-2017]